MNIQTERCQIRPFAAGDLDEFIDYRNNLDWMRYQGFKGLSRAEYETHLLGDSSLAKGMQLAIAHGATGQLLGDVYLRQQGAVYWLGYTIHPRHARKGYAAEAAAALILWAKQQGGAQVKAGVMPQNKASIQLLETLGFAHAGQEDDELVYTIDLK